MEPLRPGRRAPRTGEPGAGDSGFPPPPATDSRFVLDDGPELDTEHLITAPGQAITVTLETTRCVGAVDPDGFLYFAADHIARGTLAATLTLSVAARISGLETGGTLGSDPAGAALAVRVLLHSGTARECSLGTLTGTYTAASDDWQIFVLEVAAGDVRSRTIRPGRHRSIRRVGGSYRVRTTSPSCSPEPLCRCGSRWTGWRSNPVTPTSSPGGRCCCCTGWAWTAPPCVRRPPGPWAARPGTSPGTPRI
ncbi:hypothetical protein ACFFWC_04990 [Plantactinospora siamensis]|uniref:Uncharacterized protein n=1 Tax=Plantactinospora siamensis TaxID=555372 RepID=A0ABV6NTD7_9ACTN